MNLSHSSEVYGKVGISDVRASDAACYFLSLTLILLNLPARAFKIMTVSSFKQSQNIAMRWQGTFPHGPSNSPPGSTLTKLI